MIPAATLLTLMWGALAAIGIALATGLAVLGFLALAELVEGRARP